MMDSVPWTSKFALADSITSHLGVHPADAALDPPASYLFVQDALIIASGIFWALAPFFSTLRCLRDKRSGTSVPLLCVQP